MVTTSTELYQTSFGFTQNDLDTALTEFESEGEAAGVRHWYDGFTFGGVPDIYNPWSITHFPRYGTFKNF